MDSYEPKDREPYKARELDTYLRDEREVLAGVDTSEEGALRLARMYQKEHSQ